jgi:eukaryotic-like serine/threonine-protein kinase
VEVATALKDGSRSTAKGLVHRDIKPSNIFLSGSDSNGKALLADFGIGKAFDAAGLSGRTRTGQTAGTPAFMSRQQMINFKYAQPDVDVWAIAATLYNLITGQLVRDYPAGQDPWHVVLQNPPIPIRNRDKGIPKSLATLLDEALDDHHELAYKSALEFKKALERAL